MNVAEVDPAVVAHALIDLRAEGNHGAADKLLAAASPPVEKAVHRHGCVYLPVGGEARARVLAAGRLIPDADLAEDGREADPHVTCLYGLPPLPAADVARALVGRGPVPVRLTRVTAFEAADTGKHYDVVKADVEGADVYELHAALCTLPHVKTHPAYVPHCTIAYVKPGLGRAWAARLGALDVSCVAPAAAYSDAGGCCVHLPLATAKAVSAFTAGAGAELVGQPGGPRRKKRKVDKAEWRRICRKAMEGL